MGVLMDPIQNINYKKDSTLAMLWAAQDRGWDISYLEQSDLYLNEGQARAQTRAIKVFRDPQRWFEFGDQADFPLEDFDVILMRKDPPFNNEFIYTTYLLENAERKGTLVVNRCQSLRDCNEKVFATEFPDCCPATLVSKNNSHILFFLETYKDIILKPLDGMGGNSVFRVKENDPNLQVILEVLTRYGEETIMAQKYLPEICEGDKRIIMICGKPAPYCLARIPPTGQTRANLAAGGKGLAQKLSDRDHWIAKQVGGTLVEKGLMFVGLDIIGNHLTEINVTSPTGIRELEDQAGLNLGKELIDAIAKKLNKNRVKLENFF